MTFWQQIISTFIGAFAGFVFSISLFYLTEKWKNDRLIKDLSSNLQKELNYNSIFLEKYGDDFDRWILQIGTADQQFYPVFRFKSLRRLFILEASNKGLLYKYLSSEEVNEIDTMLDFFTELMDQIHIRYTEDYKFSKVTQQKALQYFSFSRGQIDRYLRLTNTLKEKLVEMK